MLTPSNIINLGLFLLTAVGVLIAGRQAAGAHKSRNDAQEASAQAARHEAAALEAAKRSAAAGEAMALEQARAADALERQVTLAEVVAPDPWIFEPLGDASMDQRWRVTNNTRENVTGVSIGTPDGVNERWIKPEDDEPIDMAPGASLYFQFIRRLTSPTTPTIWVFWTPARGSAQEQFIKSI